MEVTFGIVIPTYWRPDGSTAGQLALCLNAVLNQSFENWKVYLIGDHYEKDEEFWELASIIPDEKLFAVNLPVADERERLGLRGEELWHCGGVSAVNYGLEQQRKDGISVTCHLDDDDCWLAEHLETLFQAYSDFPKSVFVYTSAWQGGREYPPTKFQIMTCDNARIDGGGALIHSSASWELDQIPFTYRQTTHCGADNDLWDRIGPYCREKQLSTLFVPKVTLMKAIRGKSVIEKYYP